MLPLYHVNASGNCWLRLFATAGEAGECVNITRLSVGGETVVGRVEKPLENRGGIQFRLRAEPRRLRRKSQNLEMAVSFNQSSTVF